MATSEPILVTGAHRSGTSWVGRMLHLAGSTGYMHEPFSPGRNPGWTARLFPYWYTYICHENETDFLSPVGDLLRFRVPCRPQLRDIHRAKDAGWLVRDWSLGRYYHAAGKRPLLKDPFALFAAPWLVERFGVRVVVMIRHPAGFASSLKRLGWQFDFRSLASQPLLLRHLAAPLAEEIQRCAEEPPGPIDQGIVLWNTIYSVVHRYREEHCDWTFLRHEDLAEDPVGRFQDLYRELDLRWSPEVARNVAAYSSSENPAEVAISRYYDLRRNSTATARIWKARLAAEEIDRIRERVEDVSSGFYSEADW